MSETVNGHTLQINKCHPFFAPFFDVVLDNKVIFHGSKKSCIDVFNKTKNNIKTIYNKVLKYCNDNFCDMYYLSEFGYIFTPNQIKEFNRDLNHIICAIVPDHYPIKDGFISGLKTAKATAKIQDIDTEIYLIY